MQKQWLGIAGAVVVLVAAFWAIDARKAHAPTDGGPVMCTTEAKMCPDGSYVGRTGPKCEFAECPPTNNDQTLIQARIGQEASGLGVRITPLTILEDSRCPVDVQCIQAGTLRLKAQLVSGLGTATQEFKLGQAVTTESETITLIQVGPAPISTLKPTLADYVFQFEVKKR
jgi:hypothetical protein